MKSKIMLIIAMAIWGSIGVFRRYIPCPSSVIALVRGIVGAVFLLMMILAKGRTPSITAIKMNWKYLLAAGGLLGFNWILLFEAYQYTSVATATLCYYMAPVFIILASPIVMKEKLTMQKLCCAGVALGGMVFVSGILDVGIAGISELKGILFGLAAAVLYAGIVMISKKLSDIDGMDITFVQLTLSAIVMLPYVLAMEDVGNLDLTTFNVFMLLVVGAVHTGVAYALYFSCMGGLKAQTIALFSYIDPVVAVMMSVLVLQESIGVPGMIGAVMILGAMIASEKE